MVLPARTQVAIAGGGPVGLAAAIELGRRGVQTLVIEPRATVTRARPRCKTVNVRSMEHLRRWGVAQRLRDAAPLRPDWSQEIVFCTSLTGRELSRFRGVLGLSVDPERSPELGQQAPQFVLEELLRDVVDELDACTLVRGARVTGVDQDDAEVRVHVSDESGADHIVAADYALGCDGARSAVRDAIGCRYVGEVALRPNFGIVFRAPELWDRVRHGPCVHYWVVNGESPGLMGPLDLDGTWWAGLIGVDRETGEANVQSLIEGLVGEPIDADVTSTDPWTAHMQLADRMCVGRVFLAGDAAHLNPPFGGHGLNTGLGDAVDIGWKIAAVLDGWAGPALLDSYEAERRPVAMRVIAEAAANNSVLPTELLTDEIDDDGAAGDAARAHIDARIQETKHAEFHALDLVLGPDHPDARAGARLPHAWLQPGRSVYDELGPDMTLLALAGEDAPLDDFATHAAQRGVPLHIADLRGRGLSERYGAALVLVRPDQHVAWCGDSAADPGALLDAARGATPLPTPTSGAT
jgi:2-polyprenyl-6-methoxyphenol hydroxylase-like FAD-dependent oxidoreductase